MSKSTSLQWCDSTANPLMGCCGCELWPTRSQITASIMTALQISSFVEIAIIKSLLADMNATEIYHARKSLSSVILESVSPGAPPRRAKIIERAIASGYRCYAGILHLRYGRDHTQPEKVINKGYAPNFETLTHFPGRMSKAASLSDLRAKGRPDKPWANGLPRLIFVSDMADALSSSVRFDYLKMEVIDSVVSQAGQKHVWLWLSKRPNRMAEFSRWLTDQGIHWPDNLVAMTSITSSATVARIEQLKEVQCRYRGLSVEPLWDSVTLPLVGISWCIVGGESGPYAKPFKLEWAYSLIAQCRESGVATFVKQLGARPYLNGLPYELIDSHGGDWDEWPMDLRVREFPNFNSVVKLPRSYVSSCSVSCNTITPVTGELGEVGLFVTPRTV